MKLLAVALIAAAAVARLTQARGSSTTRAALPSAAAAAVMMAWDQNEKPNAAVNWRQGKVEPACLRTESAVQGT